MPGGPINPDREQQRADNIASRRQSGLEPRPRDLKEEPAEERPGTDPDRLDRDDGEGRDEGKAPPGG